MSIRPTRRPGGFEQKPTTTAAAARGRTFEQAEPHYRAGYSAAHDERYSRREFEDVEPELRSEYEAQADRTGARGPAATAGSNCARRSAQGWNKARNR